jgi:spermidine/putrescine transport system substrate-binding protein
MTDPSLDRFFDRVVNDPTLSRRDVLRRMSALGLVVGGGSLLAACGGVEGTAEDDGSQQDRAASVNHPKTEIDRLNFTNWPLYIDVDEKTKKRPTLEAWEREHGATIKYSEEINDNEEFFGKVRAQLERKQDIERDIVVLTDWMAGRWIKSGFVEPIDKKNVPNAENLVDTLKSVPFDEDRSYTLPWQSGMTAIGFDRRRAGDIKSIEQLFDPKLKGRVTLFSDAREVANLFLFKAGKDPANATIDDVLAAIEEAKKANDSGQVRRFTGNDYTTDLTKGNVWATMAYSGDIIQLQADNPNLEFVIPEEGGTLWSDNMMMPLKVQHAYAAETFMNHVYQPEVAAQIAAYVNYVTPVKGTQEVLAEEDPELAENELIFPDDQTLGRLRSYVNLEPAEERRMNEAMQQVVGG